MRYINIILKGKKAMERMDIKLRNMIVLCLIFVLAGCATIGNSIYEGNGEKQVTSDEESEYVLGAGDVIGINVRGDEEASGNFSIGPNGYFFHPYLGDVKAEGFTREELKKEVEEKIRKYVKDAEVIIGIVKYRTQWAYITGEVNAQGQIPLERNMTLMEFIVKAGGFTEFANKKKVMVIRKGVQKPFIIDCRKIEKGKADDDFVIKPNDRVRVPRRWLF